MDEKINNIKIIESEIENNSKDDLEFLSNFGIKANTKIEADINFSKIDSLNTSLLNFSKEHQCFFNQFNFIHSLQTLVKITFNSLDKNTKIEDLIQDIEHELRNEISLFKISYDEKFIIISIEKSRIDINTVLKNNQIKNPCKIVSLTEVKYDTIENINDNKNDFTIYLSDLKQDAINKIGEGETSNVLEFLGKQLIPNSDLFKEFILLKSTFVRICKSNRIQEIDYDKYIVHLNKLNKSLIEFINNLTINSLILSK